MILSVASAAVPAETVAPTCPAADGPAASLGLDPNAIAAAPRGFGREVLPAGRARGDSVPYRMLAAAAIVLVLGLATYLVLKKLLPKVRKTASRDLAIVASAYLGPNKLVHVLRVGSRRILVATWRDGVAGLGDVTDAFAEYERLARSLEGNGGPGDGPDVEQATGSADQ